jgi:hypothetical protein
VDSRQDAEAVEVCDRVRQPAHRGLFEEWNRRGPASGLSPYCASAMTPSRNKGGPITITRGPHANDIRHRS